MLALGMKQSCIHTMILCASLALSLPACHGGEPVEFPWGCPPPSVMARVPYQVLARPTPEQDQAVPLQSLPKASYAYGWFGSNPPSPHHGQWGRHFGFNQNFTQWTSR